MKKGGFWIKKKQSTKIPIYLFAISLTTLRHRQKICDLCFELDEISFSSRILSLSLLQGFLQLYN